MQLKAATLCLVAAALGGCKTAAPASNTKDDAPAAAPAGGAAAGVNPDTLAPRFWPAQDAGKLAAIRMDLLSNYCASSCHGFNDANKVFTGQSQQDVLTAVANNATLITRVLTWEGNTGLTMPQAGSSERSRLAKNQGDRQAILASLAPFVSKDPAVTAELAAGVRRGVQMYGSFNAGSADDAQTTCQQRGNEAVNNMSDYCDSQAKVQIAPDACDPAKSCSGNGTWSCTGTFAWVCVKKADTN